MSDRTLLGPLLIFVLPGTIHRMSETIEQNNDIKIVAPDFASIDDFQKIELRIGTVLSVNVIEGADKLYILQVDLGEEKPRQILSGIREFVSTEELLGKQFPFVTNLAPRMLRGHESQGMILAGSDSSGLALLTPSKLLENGTRLR